MNFDDYIEWRIKWFFLSRFLLACIGMIIGMLVGVGFVIYRVCSELSLESGYRSKYGADWQAEFEKYHGSLSHAHAQIAVSVTCLLAIVAVLTWFCRVTFHKHKHSRREHVV
jgi:hypothetical protein